jgi:hypothetical protein
VWEGVSGSECGYQARGNRVTVAGRQPGEAVWARVEGLGAARRREHAAPGSGAGGRMSGGENGFADEAGHIEGRGQDVRQEGGFGAVGQAKVGGAFDAAAGLVGVTTLGVE